VYFVQKGFKNALERVFIFLNDRRDTLASQLNNCEPGRKKVCKEKKTLRARVIKAASQGRRFAVTKNACGSLGRLQSRGADTQPNRFNTAYSWPGQ